MALKNVKYATKEQYEELIARGSVVIDGETVLYGNSVEEREVE